MEALAIGLVAGVVCLLLGAVIPANIVSEPVGAIVAALLMKIPFEMNIKKVSLRPTVITFFSTLASGYSFFIMMKILLIADAGFPIDPDLTIAIFSGIIFGTAAINSLIVMALYPALRAVMRSKDA